MAETQTMDQTRTAPQVELREQGMPDGQAPARQQGGALPARQETAVDQAKRQAREAHTAFLEAVLGRRRDFEDILAPMGIPWDTFYGSVRLGLTRALSQDREFFTGNLNSYFQAVMSCCELGLVPNGRQAAIVRYKFDFQCLPMIEGFSKILYETGLVLDINHDIVIPGDEFDFSLGTDAFVKHRPKLTRDENLLPEGAWCLIRLRDGGQILEVTPRKALEQIAATSKAANGPRSVWAGQMHRKAPFRRAIKRAPHHKRLELLLKVDDANYTTTPRLMGESGRPLARVPNEALFSHQRHVEPEDIADPPAQDDVPTVEHPRDEEQGSDSDRAPVQEEEIKKTDPAEPLIKMLAVCRTEEALDDAIAEVCARADFEDLDQQGQAVVTAAADRQRDLILNPAPLLARLSSSGEPKPFDDPRAWMSDVLNKMSSLTKKQVGTFWKHNLPLILDARGRAPAEAARVLQVGQERGMPIELPC